MEDGVGFVEGRDADGRVMYCMDPDLHYPDRGTEVSLMGQADDVTAYLVYYGHGGQGDTGRRSHFVTQQAIWYHTDPDCDAATGKVDAGWKPRAFTEETPTTKNLETQQGRHPVHQIRRKTCRAVSR